MKVIIIGPEKESINMLARHELMEKFGKNVEIYTPETAHEAGLTEKDFGNIPSFKIEANPMMLQSPPFIPKQPKGHIRPYKFHK